MQDSNQFIDVEALFEQIEYAVLNKLHTGQNGQLLAAKARLHLHMAERSLAIKQRKDLMGACGQARFALRELLPDNQDAQMTVQMLETAMKDVRA